MKYSEILNTVNLIIEVGDVPLIIGESGIGKTALVKDLARINGYETVTIDANLLKEGEIGGLPIVRDGKTIYATHYKLIDLNRKASKNNGEALLFIDELNRCEHAVQQELMNLILNREINGYVLPHGVKVVAAMNPSNKYDNFENSEYQVVDMDPAQEDRFVWLNMESDIKEWIRWGMGKGNIHPDIIEFLSAFPGYLHTPDTKENLKATPRSWERISKAYTLYKSKEKYPLNILLNVVKGNVGVSIATDFANFIANKKKPLMNAKELFSYEVLPEEIKDELYNESQSRLYILAKSALNYLEDNNKISNIALFSEILKCYPRDLRLGIMKEIRKDYSKSLYEALLDSDEFMEAFFEIYVSI